ncbi:MAG: hypothetical protein AAB268_11805, partial [Elusimicrobiota bacterium]
NASPGEILHHGKQQIEVGVSLLRSGVAMDTLEREDRLRELVRVSPGLTLEEKVARYEPLFPPLAPPQPSGV